MKKISEQIEVPVKLAVFEDKKTRARSVAFPFDYPTGEHGVIIMTKLNAIPWQPSDYVKSITINFNENAN